MHFVVSLPECRQLDRCGKCSLSWKVPAKWKCSYHEYGMTNKAASTIIIFIIIIIIIIIYGAQLNGAFSLSVYR